MNEQQTHQIKALGDRAIYFYDDITSATVLELIAIIQKMDTELNVQYLSGKKGDPRPIIELHMQSGGGWTHSALGMADIIQSLNCPVHSFVEGMAASGASLITMGCAKRYITRNSFFMIHQLSGIAWGTHEEMKEEIDFQNLMMETMTSFYKKHSNLSKKKLASMLKKNIWLDAKKTVEYGFADEIL